MISRMLGASIILGLFVQSAWSGICSTIEECQNNVCKCTVSANAIYGRYFYLDFPNIQKGNRYQFNFTSSPDTTFLDLKNSTFPIGIVTYFSDLESFIIDATTMQNTSDHIKIKYYIPASDIPTDISSSLQIIT